MATVQTTIITLSNNLSSDGSFFVAHRTDSKLQLKAISPEPLGWYLEFPRSVLYVLHLKPGETVQLAVQSEAGPDAVMDYWYVAFQLNAKKPNLCSFFADSGTVLMPLAPFKAGSTMSFGIAPGNSVGQYLISLGTNVGGSAQPRESHISPVMTRGIEPMPTIRMSIGVEDPFYYLPGYVRNVKALKSAPSRLVPPTRSRYDDYVLVHMLAMRNITVKDKTGPIDNGNIVVGRDRAPMWAHQGPSFLPWHRVFLREIERDFQETGTQSPGWGIPYWNWAVDSATTKAPWTDSFMGSGTSDGPVQRGPFAGRNNWPVWLSENGLDHLVRGLGQNPAAKTLPSPSDVDAALNASPYDAENYDSDRNLKSFRNILEGFASGSELSMHNRVHAWVGGNNGQMLKSDSPNDPVFFLHHANIDRLWTVWQQRNSNATPPVPFYLPEDPFPSRPGIGSKEPMIFMDTNVSSAAAWSGSTAPADVVSHYLLNYCYDTELRGGGIPR